MSYRSEGTFKLVIYESEYRQIQAWTNKHQDLETGGDLFGLWKDDRTAVVQLVVGPGKQCRRTSTSFYQDVDYLERMVDGLTSEEGLCHIGEWHSHHTLGLSRPSGGDESTIWSNMERYGLSRFVLFIANIIDTTWSWSRLSFLANDETTVNGFLFEVDRSIDRRYQHRRRLPVLQAEFIYLQEENPFRSKYLNAIREGAESLNSAQDLLRTKYQQMESGWKKVLQENKKIETSLAAEQKARKETDKRLRSSEEQAYRLRESLTATRQAKEETEKRLESIMQQAYQLQSSLAAQTKAREEAERRLHSSEQRWRELETTLGTVQQELEESLSSMEPCDWIVERNEISLSTTEIGVGGWGRVVEGIFGGCKVAVKEIHQTILSPYNRRLFEREMNIASKCRHPCLLQFIGATNDDQSPLFVTELLETSLRAVLHERPLEPTEITTIALDVAKGLNYLHLKRPDPIIHRDISSANVLLWKKGADWRAKVSDYGTANILQQTMTVCPGTVIYSAPEAQTSRQSPKVDVYSFGVLLCEMNIREQPDVSQRKQQISRVTNHIHRRLIRTCLLQNSEERPSMAEIVEEIKDSE